MRLEQLQSKLKIGDFVEIFNESNGRKMFAGYCTQIYANAFVLTHEMMTNSGSPRFEAEFVQGKQFSANFVAPSLLANWYEKHL